MNDLVRVEDISKIYKLGKVKVPALRNIRVGFVAGEFAAISGPSGSGKTTLLNLIGLIDQPSSGHIQLENQTISYNGLSRLHKIRLQKIGFIFQSFNLIPVLNAYENVEYPLLLSSLTASERKKRVEELLGKVGIFDQRFHKPKELSGGQRQRVAIARALVNKPKIVLADEPTANIDSDTTRDILDLMAKLNRIEGVTFIFSTHDALVVEMANRVIKLKDGEVVDGK